MGKLGAATATGRGFSGGKGTLAATLPRPGGGTLVTLLMLGSPGAGRLEAGVTPTRMVEPVVIAGAASVRGGGGGTLEIIGPRAVRAGGGGAFALIGPDRGGGGGAVPGPDRCGGGGAVLPVGLPGGDGVLGAPVLAGGGGSAELPVPIRGGGGGALALIGAGGVLDLSGSGGSPAGAGVTLGS